MFEIRLGLEKRTLTWAFLHDLDSDLLLEKFVVLRLGLKSKLKDSDLDSSPLIIVNLSIMF